MNVLRAKTYNILRWITTSRKHWIQRITFTVKINAACSRYMIQVARQTHSHSVTAWFRAPQYLRSLSGARSTWYTSLAVCTRTCHIQALHDHLQVSATLNGMGPIYLSEMCRPISSVAGRRHLRSADRGQQLIVLRYRLTTAGRRAFSCAGPSAWNSLPEYLRDESLVLDSFKHSLKYFLFALYWHSASNALEINSLMIARYISLHLIIIIISQRLSLSIQRYNAIAFTDSFLRPDDTD